MAAEMAEMPKQVDSPMEYDLWGLEAGETDREIEDLEVVYSPKPCGPPEPDFEDEMNEAFAARERQEEEARVAVLEKGLNDGGVFGDGWQDPEAPVSEEKAEQVTASPAKAVKKWLGLALPPAKCIVVPALVPEPTLVVPEPPQAMVVEPPAGVTAEMPGLSEKKAGKQPKTREQLEADEQCVAYTDAKRVPVQSAGKVVKQLLPQRRIPKKTWPMIKKPLEEFGGPEVALYIERAHQIRKDLPAYPGAQVPGQKAAKAAGRSSLDLDGTELMRGADMEYAMEGIDLHIAALDGTTEQQQAPAPTADMGAGNELAGPADAIGDLDAADSQSGVRQQQGPPVAGQQGAEIAPAVQAAPVVDLTAVPDEDDVDIGFAQGIWGRWNPKGMSGPAYVYRNHQPYDSRNPRDVHDYMQAVVVSLVRRPFHREHEHTTLAALYWFDQAWKLVCTGLRDYGKLFHRLTAEVQEWVRRVWPWVQNGSLLRTDVPALANEDAQMDVSRAFTALTWYQQMAGNVQQQHVQPQPAGEVIVID